MRVVTHRRRAALVRVPLLVAVVAASLVGMARPAAAHTPHHDIFDVAVSPQYATDNSLVTISRGLALRSTDRGVTWQRLVTGIDSREQPYAVAYGGSSGSRVYLATADAVFRSDDGGTVWQRIFTAPAKDLRLLATTTGAADSLVVGGSSVGAVLTTNGGSTWSTSTFGASVTSLAFKRNSTQVIFAGDAAGVLHVTGNAGGLWRPYSLGTVGAVTTLSPSPAFSTDGLLLAGTSTGGIIQWDHPNRVATPINVGLTDNRVTSIAHSARYASDDRVFASTWTGGMFVSVDRGATWAPSNQGLVWNAQPTTPAYSDRPNFGTVVPVLADGAGIQQDLFLASFTGLYRSTDLGATWAATETLPANIFVGLAVSPQFGTDQRVAASTYINGAHVSADGGSTWAPSNLGLAQVNFWHAGPDRFARLYNITYAPPILGKSRMFTASAAGVLRSDDWGASWSLADVPGFSDPGFDAETPRVPHLVVSPTFALDQTVLLVDGGNGAAYRSTDGGVTFTSVGVMNRRPNCLQASPSFATDHRFLACTSAGVYVSTDYGATWSNSGPSPSSVQGLAVSVQTGVGETWWAATLQGLFRSDTAGSTWTAAAVPGPAVDVVAVAASPPAATPATILATVRGHGLVRSSDGGATFSSTGAGLLTASEQLDNFNYKPAGTPIVFSPAFAADQTVFGYSNDHLLKSVDAGTTWQLVTPPVAIHTGAIPKVPTAPVIGAAVGDGSGSATVTFTPSADGGAPVLRFDASCTSANGGSPAAGSGPASPVGVSGMTVGKTYTCQVTATNVLGTSLPSAASNAVGPLSSPSAPGTPVAVAGGGGATVSWTAPVSTGGSPITGYVVQAFIGYFPLTPVVFSSTSTIQFMSGLTNGTPYRFRVAAINAEGTGQQSALSNPVTPADGVPGAPGPPSAVAGGGGATVSWTAPLSDGGSPITGYAVQPFVGFAPLTPVVFSSASTTQFVSGLTNGTQYRFKVAAITSAGTGPQSGASNAVVPTAGLPGAPSTPTAVAGAESATVSWAAPLSDGGSPITGYTVQGFIGFFPLTPIVFPSDATTQIIPGLTAGTQYRFKVAAITLMGTGAQSSPSNPVTPSGAGVTAAASSDAVLFTALATSAPVRGVAASTTSRDPGVCLLA